MHLADTLKVAGSHRYLWVLTSYALPPDLQFIFAYLFWWPLFHSGFATFACSCGCGSAAGHGRTRARFVARCELQLQDEDHFSASSPLDLSGFLRA